MTNVYQPGPGASGGIGSWVTDPAAGHQPPSSPSRHRHDGGDIDTGLWTSYTPTVSQSGTVTYTATYTRFSRIGSLVVAQFHLAITGAGTAGSGVTVGLPVTAAGPAATDIGSGLIFHTATATVYTGEWSLTTSTAMIFNISQASAAAWGVTPNVALANGDAVRGHVIYEAA